MQTPDEIILGQSGDLHARRREEARLAGEIRKQDKQVLQEILMHPPGRWWMERLLDYTEMFAELYRDDGDALGMAKRDGRASVGRFLTSMMEEHTPNQYMRMLRERRARLETLRQKLQEQRRAQEGAGNLEDNALTDIEQMADRQAEEAAEAEAKRKRQMGQKPTTGQQDASS